VLPIGHLLVVVCHGDDLESHSVGDAEDDVLGSLAFPCLRLKRLDSGERNAGKASGAESEK
jgi:hypothetical protein